MPRKARREVATRIKPTMTPMKPPVRRSRNGGARVGARVGAPAKGDGRDAAKKTGSPPSHEPPVMAQLSPSHVPHNACPRLLFLYRGLSLRGPDCGVR